MEKESFSHGGEGNDLDPNIEDKKELEGRRGIVNEYIEQLEGIPDDQVINIHEFQHSSGGSITRKTTAGEFRKKAIAAAENKDDGYWVVVELDNGARVALNDVQDAVSIEPVTPEVEAHEEEEARNWKIIEGLKAMGIDERVFVDHPEFGDSYIKFKPHQILEIGKKIEAYLNEQRENKK